jgi:hypothetical protein
MNSIKQAFDNQKIREQIHAYGSYNINIDVTNRYVMLSSLIYSQIKS